MNCDNSLLWSSVISFCYKNMLVNMYMFSKGEVKEREGVKREGGRGSQNEGEII